jgi:tetratricopeptide (TPR) repeat protein
LNQYKGNLDQAIKFYRQSVEVYQMAGDRQGEGNALANLGGVATGRGDFPLALETFQQVFSLALETNDKHGQGHAQNYLGQIATQLGQFDTSSGYFDRAMTIYQEINDQRSIGHVHLNRSILALFDEKPSVASTHAKAALAHTEKWHDPPSQGAAWFVTGQALISLHNFGEAKHALNEAKRIFSDLDATNPLMEVYAAYARLHLMQNQPILALKMITPVLDRLAVVFDTPEPEEHHLFGVKHPFLVYLTCFHVLKAVKDARASRVIEKTHYLLTHIAEKIQDDTLWHSYLENIRSHAEIMSIGVPR